MSTELSGATLDERISALVGAVGGPVRAATLLGKTRTHIDNMRKAGAPLRLEDVLILAREAGVTLDWVTTGHAVRPDLRGLSDARAGAFDGLPDFVRLLPLRPELANVGGRTIERWTPSEFAMSTTWLDAQGLGRLIADSESGPIAFLLLAGGFMITFGSLVAGGAIMSLPSDNDDDHGGGRRRRYRLSPIRVPAQRSGRRSSVQRDWV